MPSCQKTHVQVPGNTSSGARRGSGAGAGVLPDDRGDGVKESAHDGVDDQRRQQHHYVETAPQRRDGAGAPRPRARGGLHAGAVPGMVHWWQATAAWSAHARCQHTFFPVLLRNQCLLTSAANTPNRGQNFLLSSVLPRASTIERRDDATLAKSVARIYASPDNPTTPLADSKNRALPRFRLYLAPQHLPKAHSQQPTACPTSQTPVAPPAVAIPHDGSFTLPEAEVMTVEQIQSHHPDRGRKQ